jgi:hypothetical protein
LVEELHSTDEAFVYLITRHNVSLSHRLLSGRICRHRDPL